MKLKLKKFPDCNLVYKIYIQTQAIFLIKKAIANNKEIIIDAEVMPKTKEQVIKKIIDKIVETE